MGVSGVGDGVGAARGDGGSTGCPECKVVSRGKGQPKNGSSNSFPLSNPKEFRINGIFAVYKLGDLRDTGT